MTFSQQTQAPGCAPPGTPVLPMLLRVGDDWPVPIVLADGLGNPRDLTGALVTARLFCPFPIDLVGQGGSIVVTNATEGQLTVTVFSVTTDRAVPQTTMARAYPCRLSLTVTDTLGLKHTYDPIPILPLQPQDDAPVPVGPQQAVLTASQQGPAGASGLAGGATSVLTIPLAAVSSKTQAHAFSYDPRVWIKDASGAEVETDVLYGASQVTVVFPAPFSGTLY